MNRNRAARVEQARDLLRSQHSGQGGAVHAADGTTTSRQHGFLTAGRGLNRRQRDELTGVPTDPSRQGWTEAHAAPHLCQPPRQYPQNCGPGSEWTCRCSAVWVARGIDLNPDGEGYGLSPERNDANLLVEQWFYRSGGVESVCRAQEPMYDWRPLGPYYVKILRLILDTAQGRDGGTTWQDLG